MLACQRDHTHSDRFCGWNENSKLNFLSRKETVIRTSAVTPSGASSAFSNSYVANTPERKRTSQAHMVHRCTRLSYPSSAQLRAYCFLWSRDVQMEPGTKCIILIFLQCSLLRIIYTNFRRGKPSVKYISDDQNRYLNFTHIRKIRTWSKLILKPLMTEFTLQRCWHKRVCSLSFGQCPCKRRLQECLDVLTDTTSVSGRPN